MAERFREIGICTDTTTSVLPEVADRLHKEYGINIVSVPSPLRRPPGGYMPDNLLDRSVFYKGLKDGPLYETSHANPKDFLDAFEKLIGLGAKEIVSIHSNLELTGGMNSATAAAEVLRDKGSKVEIFRVDSGTVSIGAGLLILEALESVKKGIKGADVANKIERIKSNVRLSIAITDSHYLIKSASRRLGFKGGVTALGAAVLRINPIVTLQGKELVPQRLVRGVDRLNQGLIAQIKTERGGAPIKRMIVGHTNDFEAAKTLGDLINSEKIGVKITDSDIWEAGVVLAVYGGESIRAISALLGSS
jgi:DegV family protein with EDD domain